MHICIAIYIDGNGLFSRGHVLDEDSGPDDIARAGGEFAVDIGLDRLFGGDCRVAVVVEGAIR